MVMTSVTGIKVYQVKKRNHLNQLRCAVYPTMKMTHKRGYAPAGETGDRHELIIKNKQEAGVETQEIKAHSTKNNKQRLSNI